MPASAWSCRRVGTLTIRLLMTLLTVLVVGCSNPASTSKSDNSPGSSPKSVLSSASPSPGAATAVIEYTPDPKGVTRHIAGTCSAGSGDMLHRPDAWDCSV